MTYPINAKTEQFEAVEIIGIPGLFTTLRVDRSTVPQGMYLYEMQTDPDDWCQPCLLGRRIMVEHFGTVLTAAPIPLPEKGYLDLAPGDFKMGSGSDRLTVTEFEDRCFGRAAPAIPRPRLPHHRKARPAPAR